VTAAIFGLLGVIVGGVLNGAVSWWLQRGEARSSARATAGVVYDDFLHMQSTLVRTLDAKEWWETSHLFNEQVGREDWKLSLSALDDEASEAVAAARGWMSYLIGSRNVAIERHKAGSRQLKLDVAEEHLMQDSFCRLDYARRKLSKLGGRNFRSFENGGVLASLPQPRTLRELGIADDQCRIRRKARYGPR
jgi:hypothetical protein